MSSDIFQPPLEEPALESDQTKTPAVASKPISMGPGTASADDLGLALGQVTPDPFLDRFEPQPTTEAAAGPGAPVAGPVAEHSTTTGHHAVNGPGLDVPSSAEIPAHGDLPSSVSAIVSVFNLDPAAAAAKPGATSIDKPDSTSTSKHFAAIDLHASPPMKAKVESARGKGTMDADDDENEDLPPRGSSWQMALLASWASAATLGLLWVLWGHRTLRESVNVEADPFPPADAAPDPGHRAGQSRKFVAPEPLPADRITTIGQTIQLGSLEVTPLEVRSGPVILRREIHEGAARRGGNDALMLKLRLKNLSTDSILVPLDEAFIRERSRGTRDSFIETGPTQQIDMFPLAIVSEWSISGQEFRELRPGESYETQVVTAPDACGHLAPEMTWRVRLRTDVNQTETLGVRFCEKEIRKTTRQRQPEPEPEAEPEPRELPESRAGRGV